MTALDALRLARETGCKVKPKTWSNRSWYYTRRRNGVVLFYQNMRASERALYLEDLINPDGSPVEWEVVPEPNSNPEVK